MSLVICPNCQHEIKDTDSTCAYCGYAMKEAAPNPEKSVLKTIAERQDIIYTEAKKKSKKGKSISWIFIAAGLLIMFIDRTFIVNSVVFLVGCVLTFGGALVMIVVIISSTISVAAKRFPPPKNKP